MANGTPESEFSIECFQNYSAPEVFIQGLAGIVNQADVEVMIRAQKQMLQRFEKTNEMLTNCNQLSASRLKAASTEFKKHTQLLTDMKKDLDYIFKKIRIIKAKLSTQYPDAFEKAQKACPGRPWLEEDEEAAAVGEDTERALGGELTKSTETLRASCSQQFTEEHTKQSDETTAENSNISKTIETKSNANNNDSKSASQDGKTAAESGQDAAKTKQDSSKEKAASSGSSSADSNSGESCTSGDNTSDTG